MSGHEKEGFYDILTGRPRYPISMYNIVRKARVEARRPKLEHRPESRAFHLPSYFAKPEGIPFTVPGFILQR